MKPSLFVAMFFVIATSACGPVETSPPHVDAGPPINDAGELCNGVCVAPASHEWLGPDLVWMGDEAAAPTCPTSAPINDFTAHGYLEGPMPCNTCTCGPTSGSCVRPAKLTAAAASCADDGPGVAHTSFDPPVNWTSGCTNASAIPAGQLCGGVSCVQSVTIAPATSEQIGCLPSPSTPDSPPPWNRFARACYAKPLLGCSAVTICAPTPPGPEFQQCFYRLGDPAKIKCPATYSNKSVFYKPFAPTCAPCACDTPTQAPCVGTLDIFQDGSCNTPLGPSITIDSTGSVCVDVPPGSALGSKKASTAFYQPGSCEPSGGAPEGTVFCCMP